MKREDREKLLLLVRETQEKAYRLLEEADDLLIPIIDDALKEGREAVKELVSVLPAGFHRAELRVWLKHQDEDTNKFEGE